MKQSRFVNIFFIAPCLLAFVLVILVPFTFGLFYSLTDWNGISSKVHFVGLLNYKDLFGKADFLHSFWITLLFTVINIILVNVVSFGLSLLVTGKVRFKNFYRAGFFVPYLIGGIVLGYIWQFIFNNVLVSVGENLSIAFFSTSLLSRADWVIWVMSVVNTWQYAGYIMIIFIAAIQSIPSSLIEAASVDGAGFFLKVFRIIAPMMANAFTVSIFLTLTTSFKQFDMNFTLTNGGPATRFAGAPVKASQLLAMNIFDTATANRMAEAQAKAVVLFLVLTVVSVIQVILNKRKEIEL